MRRSRLATVGIVGATALALLGPTAASAATGDTGTNAATTAATANQSPTAIDQSLPVAQGTAVDFVLNATDAEGDALTFTTNTPAHGTLTGTAPDLTYTPAPGYSGPDVFVFRASDGVNPSVVATVYISVYVPPNHPPVAYSQAITTRVDLAVPITLTAIDADADPLSYSLLTWSYCHCSAQHGTVTGGAGSYVYTPRAGYTGPDYFEFRATDSAGAASVARVDITVVQKGHRVRGSWQ